MLLLGHNATFCLILLCFWLTDLAFVFVVNVDYVNSVLSTFREHSLLSPVPSNQSPSSGFQWSGICVCVLRVNWWCMMMNLYCLCCVLMKCNLGLCVSDCYGCLFKVLHEWHDERQQSTAGGNCWPWRHYIWQHRRDSRVSQEVSWFLLNLPKNVIFLQFGNIVSFCCRLCCSNCIDLLFILCMLFHCAIQYFDDTGLATGSMSNLAAFQKFSIVTQAYLD